MLTCWVPDFLQMEICPLYIPRARCCPSAVHAAHNTCWCPPTCGMWNCMLCVKPWPFTTY
jgi:hypothetical protein